MSKTSSRKKKSKHEGYDINDATEYSTCLPPIPQKELLAWLDDDALTGKEVCFENDERYQDGDDIFKRQDAEWENLLQEHDEKQDTSSEIDRDIMEDTSVMSDMDDNMRDEENDDGDDDVFVAPVCFMPRGKLRMYKGPVVAFEDDFIP